MGDAQVAPPEIAAPAATVAVARQSDDPEPESGPRLRPAVVALVVIVTAVTVATLLLAAGHILRL